MSSPQLAVSCLPLGGGLLLDLGHGGLLLDRLLRRRLSGLLPGHLPLRLRGLAGGLGLESAGGYQKSWFVATDTAVPHLAFYATLIQREVINKIGVFDLRFKDPMAVDADFILRAVEIYKNILDPKIIKLESLGHFSFLIKELPELLEEIEN